MEVMRRTLNTAAKLYELGTPSSGPRAAICSKHSLLTQCTICHAHINAASMCLMLWATLPFMEHATHSHQVQWHLASIKCRANPYRSSAEATHINHMGHHSQLVVWRPGQCAPIPLQPFDSPLHQHPSMLVHIELRFTRGFS